MPHRCQGTGEGAGRLGTAKARENVERHRGRAPGHERLTVADRHAVVQDQVTIRGDTAQVDTIIDQTLLGGYYITKQECYAGDKIFFNQITEYDRFAGAYMCDKAEWYYHETPSTPYNITKPQLTLNPL